MGANWPSRRLSARANDSRVISDRRSETIRVMTAGPNLIVREPREVERAWIAEKLQGWWGSTLIVSANGAWETTRLPALVAARQDDLAGVATFEVSETGVHLITLNRWRRVVEWDQHSWPASWLRPRLQAASAYG